MGHAGEMRSEPVAFFIVSTKSGWRARVWQNGSMVCIRCAKLASEYRNVLRTYLDLLEFRKTVDQRGRAFALLQARLAEMEKRLRQEWYWLSEHRSRHHYFSKRTS
jgi:hypothetical protein